MSCFPELVDDVLADVVPGVAVVEDQLLVVDGRQPEPMKMILIKDFGVKLADYLLVMSN
jgi:hypothetical protein